jgi:hypothetical protein
VEEGEIAVVEEGKARIRARRIGETFAVVEGAAQIVVLKLEDQNKTDVPTNTASPGGVPGVSRNGQPNYPSMRNRVASGRD